MPIYDYVCSSCRHRVEVIHGIHDPGPHFCPSCGTEGTMRKALVPPAIHFKGSGWAKKDRSSTSGARKSSGSSNGGDAAAPDAGKASAGSGQTGDSTGSSTSTPSTSSED